MILTDRIRFVTRSLRSQPMRTGLTALGIAVGIAAVVLLTSIGEGINRYVLNEFTQFGTNLIAVTPGKTNTFGISAGVFGTERPLSLDDSEALRTISGVQGVVPVVQGNAQVDAGRRSRRTEILGVGPDAFRVWNVAVATGRGLPQDDIRAARPLAIVGPNLGRELFGNRSPLGQIVRVAGTRFRIIGVLEAKGQILGFDLDSAIYVPAARALELFNREGLMEIDLLYSHEGSADRVSESIKRVLTRRHGREDFTIITQDQMLQVLEKILAMLTGAVAALGGISLIVGGVGILTIMTIAVAERTPEVGLLRAVGGERREIMALFLGEAVLLAATGGISGLVIGAAIAWALSIAAPALPIQISPIYSALAVIVAVVIGLITGVIPARNAARLDPIDALRSE